MPEAAYSITHDEQLAYDAKQFDDEWQNREDQQSLEDLWRAQSDARAAFTGGEAQYQAAGDFNTPAPPLDELPQITVGPSPQDGGDVTKPDLLAPTGRAPESPAPDMVREAMNKGLESAIPITRKPENIADALSNAAQQASQSNILSPASLLTGEGAGLANPSLAGIPGLSGGDVGAGESGILKATGKAADEGSGALRDVPRVSGQATQKEIDDLLNILEAKQKTIDRAVKLGTSEDAPILQRLRQEVEDGKATLEDLDRSLIPEEVKGGVPEPVRVDERAAMLDRREGNAGPEAPARAPDVSGELGTPDEGIVPQPFDLSKPSLGEEFKGVDAEGTVGQPLRTPLPYGETPKPEILAAPEPLTGGDPFDLQHPGQGQLTREHALPPAVRGGHVVPLEQPPVGPRVADAETPPTQLRGGEARAAPVGNGGEGGYKPPSAVPPRGPGEPPSTVLPEGSGNELARLHKASNLPPTANRKPLDIYRKIQQWFTDENVDINRLGTASEEANSAFLGVRGGGFARADREISPIFAAAGKEDIPFLNDYLAVQRDLEVRGAKGNPDRAGIAGFTSNEEASRALQQLQQHLGPERFKRIEALAGQVYDTYGRLLQDKVEAGLVSPQLAEWLRTNYPHYSATIITHYLEDTTHTGGGGAGAIRQMQNTIKALTEKGTISDQLPPLQAAIKAQMEGHTAIERNYLLRTMADDLGAAPRPYKVGDEKTSAVFWLNGKRVSIDVDPDLLRTINRLDTEKLNNLLKAAGASNALLRNTAVTYNPAFVLINPVADAFTANYQVGANPVRTAQAAMSPKDNPFYQFMAERGALMSLTGGGWHSGEARFTMNPNFQWSELTKGHIGNFVKNLVSTTPFESSYNFAELEKAIAKSGGVTLHSSKIDGLTKVLTSAPDAVRELGETMEMATRMGVARKELENAFVIANGAKPTGEKELLDWARQPEQRRTVNHVVTMSRRGSIDFARFGSVMRTMNALHPFANVGEQAGLNLFRALRGDNPSARLKAIGLVTAGATGYAWNHQPGFEDRYDAIPAYEKANGMPLLLPGGVRSKDGADWAFNPHITIPTRSLAFFTSLGDEAARLAMEFDKNPAAALNRIIGSVDPIPDSNIKSISGLGPTAANVWGRLGAFGLNLLPVPLQSVIEVGVNTNAYTGAPIVSESMKRSHPNSPNLWAGAHTTEAAKRLGDLANVPPSVVDFLVTRNIAGVGRMALQGASIVMGQESDKPPVVGGLISGLYKTTGGEVLNDAYDKRDEDIQKIQKKYKDVFTKMDVGGSPVTSPPPTISIQLSSDMSAPLTLRPAEQAVYLGKKMEKVRDLMLQYQDKIAPLDVDSRKKYLKLIDDAGDAFAIEALKRSIPVPQIMERLRQYADDHQGIGPRDYTTQEQFVPDLVPAGVR